MSKTLVAIGGLPATGKTTLADELAASLPVNVARISADVVRKELAGVPHDQKLPDQFYDKAFSRKVTEEFRRRMKEAFLTHDIVVIDSTFVYKNAIEGLRELTASWGVALVPVYLTAPVDELIKRAEARQATRHIHKNASDGDGEIVKKFAEFRKNPPPGGWHILDALKPIAENVAEITALLLPQPPRPGVKPADPGTSKP